MKLIFQITIVVGLIKSGINSVRLRGKVLQHPNVKQCMIELTDSVYHLILICTKEFHVYLKNLTNHNVTPWLHCPSDPFFAVGLIDDKNELIVCRQKTIQDPIELWCEKSSSLPKNYKCEDTYVFDDELPSTSATFFSLTNSSGILSSNALNQPVLDTSNVALGNVNNFIETKWMLLLGGFIGILLILLLLSLTLKTQNPIFFGFSPISFLIAFKCCLSKIANKNAGDAEDFLPSKLSNSIKTGFSEFSVMLKCHVSSISISSGGIDIILSKSVKKNVINFERIIIILP